MNNETSNFVRLYSHVQGYSEVPRSFHIWSCISMIAACVADRVWVKLIEDQPIYPHLFTFLIAPSGIGKNIAITAVEKLVVADRGIADWVNHYRGKLTGPSLYDLLGTNDKKKEVFDEEEGKYIEEEAKSKVWFVTPEMRNSMGSPEMAQLLILTMTELWSAAGTTFTDQTRTHGRVVVENPCINWLAGTTKEWLMKAVKPEDIRGGFFARCLPVFYGGLYPKEPVYRPKYPKDRTRVWNMLQERVYRLCQLEGEMKISSDADARIEQWYMNEERPLEEGLAPYHNRRREMIMKLAIIFALADNEKMRIEWKHFDLARKNYLILQKDVLELIELACQTPQTSDARIVERIIKREGTIARGDITKKVYSKGMDSKRVEAAVQQLIQMDLVSHKPAPYGKDLFIYNK